MTIEHDEGSETAILGRAINPSDGCWTPDAARSILDIKLTANDVARLSELAEKARAGTLVPSEDTELENYRHVGRILELMKAKARMSLRKAAIAS